MHWSVIFICNSEYFRGIISKDFILFWALFNVLNCPLEKLYQFTLHTLNERTYSYVLKPAQKSIICFIWQQTYTYVCMRMFMCTCMCICMYMYIHMYMYMYKISKKYLPDISSFK